MTTGVYSNLLNKVAQRIYAKKTTLGIDHIQIGPKPDRLQAGDTYVLISPDNPFITEEYGRSVQNRRKDGTLNLTVWCQHPIVNRDAQNVINDDSDVIDDKLENIIDGSGVFLISNEGVSNTLNFIEGVLDAINTNLDSSLDPQLVDASLSMSMSVQNFVKHESSIEFEISLGIRSIPFTINDRQQLL